MRDLTHAEADVLHVLAEAYVKYKGLPDTLNVDLGEFGRLLLHAQNMILARPGTEIARQKTSSLAPAVSLPCQSCDGKGSILVTATGRWATCVLCSGSGKASS